jgi:hypothetical protein
MWTISYDIFFSCFNLLIWTSFIECFMLINKSFTVWASQCIRVVIFSRVKITVFIESSTFASFSCDLHSMHRLHTLYDIYSIAFTFTDLGLYFLFYYFIKKEMNMRVYQSTPMWYFVYCASCVIHFSWLFDNKYKVFIMINYMTIDNVFVLTIKFPSQLIWFDKDILYHTPSIELIS